MNFQAVVVVLMLTVPYLSVAGDEQVWKDLIRESHSLHNQKQYDRAVDKAAQALSLAERSFGSGDLRVASTLKQLAYVYSYQRRYPESIPLLRRALDITETNYGPNHPEVAAVLGSLARHLGNNNERDEAQQLYLRAVDIRERALGPEHLDLAYDLMALARYAQLGKEYAQAESLHTRALKIRIKHLKPDHGWIAESWSALARLYLEMERYDDAVAAQSRALAIKITRHGAQHPNTKGYRATLKQMQAASARHRAGVKGSGFREAVMGNPTGGSGSTPPAQMPKLSSQAAGESGKSIQIRHGSPNSGTTENDPVVSLPGADLDFSGLAREFRGLKLVFDPIGPIEALFYVFIALALVRVFVRARKMSTPGFDVDTVQDMNYKRRVKR